MIPRRYLIATLFIAGMLLLLAVVQAGRSTREGGAVLESSAPGLALAQYEKVADLPLQDGWRPRFEGAVDPDQPDPWPTGGGFGLPWEPASAYLGNTGVALNGPAGQSEVALWQGLEWRHYRFPSLIASARLDPRGRHLLVTLLVGRNQFQTRLLEVPEGRVLWSVDSGPWSRFSWDGQAVLLGLRAPGEEGDLLLTTLPVGSVAQDTTLSDWAGNPIPPTQLWEDGQDLPGHRLLIPWGPQGGRLWMSRRDRLWVSQGGRWKLWSLEREGWRLTEAGDGVLAAHPPEHMAKIDEEGRRALTRPDRAEWAPVPSEASSWPAYDPAWTWKDEAALTSWDQRWGSGWKDLPPERQREGLHRAHLADWKVACGLRASVAGWLPNGPEIALREAEGTATVWVGHRVLLLQLPPSERMRRMKGILRLP